LEFSSETKFAGRDEPKLAKKKFQEIAVMVNYLSSFLDGYALV